MSTSSAERRSSGEPVGSGDCGGQSGPGFLWNADCPERLRFRLLAKQRAGEIK